MRTLSADMSVYSDIELEFFVKELTEALDCIETLSEPEEEYAEFADYIDVTKSPIFFGYTEGARKNIDRILNTIYTEQELRSTLKEEMMKKLDAYSLSQLTSIYYTVITDIEQHKDLLEMLSEGDGTSFKKDTENYIEKQDRYLKLITDVIKKRNDEAGQNTGNNDNQGGEQQGGNEQGGEQQGGEQQGNDQQGGEQHGDGQQGDGQQGGEQQEEGQQNNDDNDPPAGFTPPITMGNPFASTVPGMSYEDPDDDDTGN